MVQSNPIFPFFQFPLGLIPPPIGNPLFPTFPSLPNKSGPHPAMSNMPMPMFMQSNKHPSPKPSQPESFPKPEQNQEKEEMIEPTSPPVVPLDLHNSSNPKIQNPTVKVEKVANVPILSTSPKEKEKVN